MNRSTGSTIVIFYLAISIFTSCQAQSAPAERDNAVRADTIAHITWMRETHGACEPGKAMRTIRHPNEAPIILAPPDTPNLLTALTNRDRSGIKQFSYGTPVTIVGDAPQTFNVSAPHTRPSWCLVKILASGETGVMDKDGLVPVGAATASPAASLPGAEKRPSTNVQISVVCIRNARLDHDWKGNLLDDQSNITFKFYADTSRRYVRLEGNGPGGAGEFLDGKETTLDVHNGKIDRVSVNAGMINYRTTFVHPAYRTDQGGTFDILDSRFVSLDPQRPGQISRIVALCAANRDLAIKRMVEWRKSEGCDGRYYNSECGQ